VLKRSGKIFSTGSGSVKRISEEAFHSRPWLFRHQDLSQALEKAQALDHESLSNTLNYSHFMGQPIFVHLRHLKYKESVLLRAHPGPCNGSELTCHWSHGHPLGHDLTNYQFLHIIIDDGRSMILAPIRLKELNGNRFIIRLPETSFAVGERRARRFTCNEVVAELFQSGFFARGELVDFSPVGFRIRVKPDPSCSFHWFNSDESVSIHLGHNKKIYFSGICGCLREQGDLEDREIVLIPPAREINRFKKRHIRNPRQQLVPSPTIVFDHPLLKKRVQLEVCNISTSGFCVHEKADEGVLMQGMIIPELTINFAGVLEMRCVAQVIHRSEDEEKGVLCGLAILDMDIEAYSRLTHVLTNATDPHAYISSVVDTDALWEFFFDSGFIYPTKYRLIQSHRNDFKETYQKLYQENPEIARHFTYQKNGRIYGHIAMVRAYERAWMIHHYASKAMDNKRTGFMVLKQIMHYLNDMCRLPSANMDYVMCYFRPNNKFPDRVFGGFARALDNQRGCSLDLFTYLPYTSLSLGAHLPDEWTLRECAEKELWELKRFYAHQSGGLLLEALGLEQEQPNDRTLSALFETRGLLRKWGVYCLAHREELKAVLIVNRSNLGFNLSELLNCIKILVIDTEKLPWQVLSTAIAKLTSDFNMKKVPILFYPFEYVKDKQIPFEKQYQLWILNVRYGFEYLEYMQRKFRMRP
jgi:hypothetical protein